MMMLAATQNGCRMSSCITVLPEPELQFRHGQYLADPRDGLSLFGPYDTDAPGHPSALSYGVIGTNRGLSLFSEWSEAMNHAWTDAPDGRDLLWPPFPGFQAAFASDWHPVPVWQHTLCARELSEAARRRDPFARAASVVDQYLTPFDEIRKLDQRLSVVICIVTDEVYRNCRPKSIVEKPIGEGVRKWEVDLRRQGQSHMFSSYDHGHYQMSVDFRRQMKARAMAYDIPIQIILESTLIMDDGESSGTRRLTPLSSRMWNLSTALYYKGGGKPWKLSTARDGVCYVGLAFRRADQSQGADTATCAAQMFLDDGDGIVFLGEYGPWYSPKDHQFHLSKEAARNLLRGTLDTYYQLHGRELTEVFLHSRSDISVDEFAGYYSAAPSGVKVVGIRVRRATNGPRLFRPEKRWPVLRGTLWQHSKTRGILFASGFKPRLRTYDGWETPVPLQIDIQHGDADIVSVARDILGLTKLNYNACNAGDTQPVTVGFSDAVGEILVSNPNVTNRRHTFKFYI